MKKALSVLNTFIGENITFKQFYKLLSIAGEKDMPVFKLPKTLIIIATWIFTKIFKVMEKNFLSAPEYAKAVVGCFSWYDCTKAKTN